VKAQCSLIIHDAWWNDHHGGCSARTTIDRSSSISMQLNRVLGGLLSRIMAGFTPPSNMNWEENSLNWKSLNWKEKNLNSEEKIRETAQAAARQWSLTPASDTPSWVMIHLYVLNVSFQRPLHWVFFSSYHLRQHYHSPNPRPLCRRYSIYCTMRGKSRTQRCSLHE